MAGSKAIMNFGLQATASGTDVWAPVTGWGPANRGIKSACASMEMRTRFGAGLLAVPAYQTANDKLNPDTAVAIPISGGSGGYANADGCFTPGSDVTLNVSGKEHIRFGWLIKSATGGTPSYAQLGGTVFIKD